MALQNPTDEKPTPPAAGVDDESSPGVPLFRSWRGVYLFVLGWFALTVVLLAVFTRWFA